MGSPRTVEVRRSIRRLAWGRCALVSLPRGMDDKWTLRFDQEQFAGPDTQFSLSSLMTLAERGYLDDADMRVQRGQGGEWLRLSSVPEIAAALARRGSTRSRVLPKDEEPHWTVMISKGRQTRMSTDVLLHRMNKVGDVSASTFIAPPARPQELRPAADWPAFWTKFGSGPWVLRKSDGTEYVAGNDDELRHWMRSGRIGPADEIFDFNGPGRRRRAFPMISCSASFRRSGVIAGTSSDLRSSCSGSAFIDPGSLEILPASAHEQAGRERHR